MIKLNVEDYCQDCPEFEAHADKLYGDNRSLNTWVYCEHKKICKRIHDYLSKKLKEKENGEEEN